MGYNHIYFKPTNQIFHDTKEVQKAHANFYSGQLTEEYAQFCVQEAIHAFWINYQARPDKCDKEVFNCKVKQFINQMLEEI